MTTPGTSAIGGSGGISGVSIGKTKALAVDDVLSWDGSNWVNVVAPSGGLTSVSTHTSTITGNGTPALPLGVAYSLPAGTVTLPYGSSVTYNTAGLIKTNTDNPASNYVWLFSGTASVNSSTGGSIPGALTLDGLAPTNNPGTSYDTSTNKFTAPSAGVYKFSIGGNFPGLTPTNVGAGWLGLSNAFGGSTTYQFFNNLSAQSEAGQLFCCTAHMYLATGDTARPYITQNTGSAQTVNNLFIIITGEGKA